MTLLLKGEIFNQVNNSCLEYRGGEAVKMMRIEFFVTHKFNSKLNNDVDNKG